MASALNYDPGVEEFKEHRSYFAAEESCAMINAPFLEQQLFFCVTCLEFQPCPMFLEALFEHSSGHMFAHLIMIKFLFSLSLSLCISVSLFLSLLPQVTRYLRGNLKVTKHFFLRYKFRNNPNVVVKTPCIRCFQKENKSLTSFIERKCQTQRYSPSLKTIFQFEVNSVYNGLKARECPNDTPRLDTFIKAPLRDPIKKTLQAGCICLFSSLPHYILTYLLLKLLILQHYLLYIFQLGY